MPRGIFVKRNGQWTEVQAPSVNDNGTWKTVQKGFVKQNGVWQQFYPSTGSMEWNVPGTYTWKVPPGVFSIAVDMVGAGGGGGGSSEVGAGGGGGGGGAGGYYSGATMAVTPGETLTIVVGRGGAGAPFVGRTSGAPGGGEGGTSSISGSQGSLVATGGGGGGGGTGADGGGGGGKIICTKLHQLGYLPDYIYEADERFGQYLRLNDPDAYHGYIKWASVVVDWMENSGPQFMFWVRDAEQRNQAQKELAISWAQRIATPWAYHMAYLMGAEKQDNFAGKLIMKTGLFVSRLVGRFAKTTETPKSRFVGYAMLATFSVFWLIAGLDRKQK